MPDQQNKFYVTTPIYYVNARPHIGHAYTTLVADILARRNRLLGKETFFLTGTDEHGQKIERSAAAAGIPPQQFADEVSSAFKTLWDRMGITYDDYIRTTEPRHAQGVQKLFTTLYDKGFIYLDSYTGAYCVSDEAFVDAPVGTPCPDCGRIIEQVTEENFFFKLSAFQEPLLNLIESNALKIENEARRNEVLSFLRGGLKDLSISRSSFTWGIPVPEDVERRAGATQKHIVYVWLDALTNYMTAIGFGDDSAEAQKKFEALWPANLHLVGKEIIRFHCVYWPAFLLAAELPLPKAITAHGWLLFDNSKMSKSKGNIVRTETILDAFGTLCPPPSVAPSERSEQNEDAVILSERSESKDPEVAHPATTANTVQPHSPQPTQQDRDLFATDVLRYFLLREIPFGQDGTFSFDALVTRYNADLANGYGNLVSRTLNLISQANGSVIPKVPNYVTNDVSREEAIDRVSLRGITQARVIDGDYVKAIMKLTGQNVDRFVENGELHKLVEYLNSLISSADGFISNMAPWKLAKLSNEPSQRKLADTLYIGAESIRIITALLHPILPYATARVWAQLGLGDIEQAARSGDLANPQWGGLQPGTRLGPLAPIFPRADKSLIETMIAMENPSNLAPEALIPQQDPRPGQPLKSATTPTPAAPVPQDTTHPGAPPRSFTETASAVAGSNAVTTRTGPTPAHSEATPSAPFNTAAAQAPITAGPADASPQITIDDFAKVELRIAQVTHAERIPKADKLLRIEVSLGDILPPRQILSGIAEHYAPEDLIGRRIIIITNLAPRKMRGLESHGMLLAASEEGGKPYLATVPEGVPLGTRLK